MDAELLATFFGVLLLLGATGVIAAWTVPTVRAELQPHALAIAATVAGGATAGSLSFSEGAGYVPCELCWWQRAAMYPIAIGLVVAALTGMKRVRRPAIVVAALGLAVSAYHVQLQLFPDQSSFCEATNPCTGRWVEAFGWMTIPQMAGISFALIIGLLSLPAPDPQESP